MTIEHDGLSCTARYESDRVLGVVHVLLHLAVINALALADLILQLPLVA